MTSSIQKKKLFKNSVSVGGKKGHQVFIKTDNRIAISAAVSYCLLSTIMRIQDSVNDTLSEKASGCTARASQQLHIPAELNLMKHLFKKHQAIKNVCACMCVGMVFEKLQFLELNIHSSKYP